MDELRELFEALNESPREAARILEERAPGLAPVVSELELVSTAGSASIDDTAEVQDALWALYALQRVIGLLVYCRQPPHEALQEGNWRPPEVELEDVVRFGRRLGLTDESVPWLHPAFHEVVGVRAPPEPELVWTIAEELWPSFLLNDLIVWRAGVVLYADDRDPVATALANHTLFWTYQRANRRTSDLSHGWGSNSQWRTEARRDLILENGVLFNADGSVDIDEVERAGATSRSLGPVSEELQERSFDEWRFLVLNRCLLKEDEQSEPWPYEMKLVL